MTPSFCALPSAALTKAESTEKDIGFRLVFVPNPALNAWPAKAGAGQARLVLGPGPDRL